MEAVPVCVLDVNPGEESDHRDADHHTDEPTHHLRSASPSRDAKGHPTPIVNQVRTVLARRGLSDLLVAKSCSAMHRSSVAA